MTGIAGHNYAEFKKIKKILIAEGYSVLDPTELFDGRTDLPWEHYMSACLQTLFDCQVLFALPGWRDSVGATLEVAAALSCGIRVYAFDEEINDWAQVDGGRGSVAKLIGLELDRI